MTSKKVLKLAVLGMNAKGVREASAQHSSVCENFRRPVAQQIVTERKGKKDQGHG